jgi:subfamily B ATP-binding cassette protein MsbA
LVGSSGAGKSTLADLIPRFHDVTSGEILVDGVNIKDYSLHAIRSLISIVTQEPILFNDTIANNIALGMETTDLSSIQQAAKIANADSFIQKKDSGYDTNIGDRGSKLSGGERQRLGIARALFKKTKLLILDEPTSSLDEKTEVSIFQIFRDISNDCTVILVTHSQLAADFFPHSLMRINPRSN